VSGPGGKQILLKDPSGNLVELFQPALVDNYKQSRFEHVMVLGADLGPALQSIKALADSST
jgi:hypothetical protein